MDVKAFSLVFCLHAVRFYASEPSCPDATFGREILEQTLETKTILKVLQQEIAHIKDKLSENFVLFNKWMQIDDIKQNLTVLYGKLEKMELKLDMFVTKLTKVILLLQAVLVYASEPSCPDTTFGREILEQTLETKTIVKVLQQEVAGIRVGLYENTVLFNERMQIDDIKQNLTVLFGKLERVEGKLDSLETTLTKDALKKPAFSVILYQTRLHQAGRDDVIKFDREISNIGGHYSELTGQFTAPMDGVYMFSASILADQNGEIWGYFKAGDKIVRINDRGTDNRHGQGSNTMVVALKRGDHVTVHGGPKIYGNSYTAFSGYLIQ